MAAAFAWLGQWQLDRAINRTDKSATISASKPVTLNVSLDTKHVYVVAGRKKNSYDSWWVIANALDENGKSVTLALGSASSELKAEAARFDVQNSIRPAAFLPVTGYWLPTEQAKRIDTATPFLLHSVSIAQLINLYSPQQALTTYPDFLKVCTSCKGGEFTTMLEPIDGQIYLDGSINWLSAFYAIEWTVFGGFAFFLWYRTVKDALEAEREATRAEG